MKALKWVLLIGATVFALSAHAMTLEQAKDQHFVGETSSGYLELKVDNNEAKQLIMEVNAKRKAKYLSLAKKNGISLNQVEALAGAKAIEKTQKGHMVKVDGQWQEK